MSLRFSLPGVLCAMILTTATAAVPRTWTSKDGTATLTATFQKSENGKMTLILPNGRSQIIDLAMMSDADVKWIADNPAPTPSPAAPATAESASSASKIPAALTGKLIDNRGKPAELDVTAGVPKYYLFYYSASWCGPCHAFTPELIKFARKMKARNASLTIILSPDDRTLEDEVAYMKELRMPWLALALDQKDAKDIPRSKWGYIPAMVLVDASGKRLLQVNDSLSKDEFLEKTEKLVREDREGNPGTALN